MKTITLGILMMVLALHDVAYAHSEEGDNRVHTAAEILLHTVVFGGLTVAGVIGVRENKKMHGKWIVL